MEQKYWEKNKTNELFGEILVKGKLIVNEKIKFIIILNIHDYKLNKQIRSIMLLKKKQLKY